MKEGDKKNLEVVELFEWLNDRRYSSKLFALNEPNPNSLELQKKDNYIIPPIWEIMQEENRTGQFAHLQGQITVSLTVLMDGTSPTLNHMSKSKQK